MLVNWMGLLHITDPRFRKYELQTEIVNKWHELQHLVAGFIIGVNRVLDRESPLTYISQAKQLIKRMPEPQKSNSMKALMDTIAQETTSRAYSIRQINDQFARLMLTDLYGLLGEAKPEYRHQIQESIWAIEKWAGVKMGNWSNDQINRLCDQYALFLSERESDQFWMLKLTVQEGANLDPIVRSVLNKMHSFPD